VLSGHSSLVGLLQLRGNLLLSGNADKSLRLWDVKTGTPNVSLSYFKHTNVEQAKPCMSSMAMRMQSRVYGSTTLK
jgi:WD40 repeat protein